jgi:hypothetical protein
MLERLHVLPQALVGNSADEQNRAAEQRRRVRAPAVPHRETKPSAPGVCPGISAGVIVTPPNTMGSPSATTTSRRGGGNPPGGGATPGDGFSTSSQSGADSATRAPRSWKYDAPPK